MTLKAPPVAPRTEVAHALNRAAAGERLDAHDAEALLHARGDDIERVLDLAAATRDEGLALAGRPGVLTYSRKVFVPLTTLCRDRCHYCVFVDTPGQLLTKRKPAFMSPEQVLAVVRQGQAMGCKEVLLTLGDRPEDRWPEARTWLDEHGFASTLAYVAHIARLVTAETGLLAHVNPGVMTAEELRMLRPTAPSMGMMLETTSRRLFEVPGQVHYGSPDKDPAVRLQVLDDAGSERVPFTTGILVGIGETLRDRAESLTAIRDAHERHGHVQEVIVQNFRAKPRTAMRAAPDAELLEYAVAVAVARLVMGPRMRIQVPPNLSDPTEFELLVRAGADDWGGVSPLTADHVNPERPWPHLDDLALATAELGFELQERLTAQPDFVIGAAQWIDPALHAAVSALADPATGLARTSSSTTALKPPIPTETTRSDASETMGSVKTGGFEGEAGPGEPQAARTSLLGATVSALADPATGLARTSSSTTAPKPPIPTETTRSDASETMGSVKTGGFEGEAGPGEPQAARTSLLGATVSALADPATGLARTSSSTTAPKPPIPTETTRSDASKPLGSVEKGGFGGVGPVPEHPEHRHPEPSSAGGSGSVRRIAEAAASDPLALDPAEWVALLEATGDDLDVLAATADDVRRYTVGEAVSLVVNRNLTSSGLRPEPTADPATFTLDDVESIATDAWDLGATELCVQGLLPEAEDPAGYLSIAWRVKAAAPDLHLHAFRPQDVRDLANRAGLSLDDALTALRDAGVDTMPGTGVKILSERVRGLIAPGDLEIDQWLEGIAAAHRAGFRTTSVLFYGHVETAAERIAHLQLLRAIQTASTGSTTGGGFTEFVPIPLPGPAGGVPLVAGRESLDEHRAMVAVSRLMLSGSIPHVQIPWTRVGRVAAAELLRSGGDDLGGTLLDGRVKPAAGIEQGLELPVADAAAIAARLFRPFRLRTTDYRTPRPRTTPGPVRRPKPVRP